MVEISSSYFQQKPKISLLYMAIMAKNFYRLWCFFHFSLSFSLPLVSFHTLHPSFSFVFQQQEMILSPLHVPFFSSFLSVSLLLRGDGRSWCFINSFLLFTLCLFIVKMCCILLQCAVYSGFCKINSVRASNQGVYAFLIHLLFYYK